LRSCLDKADAGLHDWMHWRLLWRCEPGFPAQGGNHATSCDCHQSNPRQARVGTSTLLVVFAPIIVVVTPPSEVAECVAPTGPHLTPLPSTRPLLITGPNLTPPDQAELATFELLLTWRMPELAAHLSEFGLPPVLYVSQWLMTLFATPFPPAFCARVIDVLLQVGVGLGCEQNGPAAH
jgi:hypothetical protein